MRYGDCNNKDMLSAICELISGVANLVTEKTNETEDVRTRFLDETRCFQKNKRAHRF